MILIIPYSTKAVLIQWEGPIRNKTISEVNLFNKAIQSSGIASITETIPAFTSITVCYGDTDFSEIKSTLEKLYSQLHTDSKETQKRSWTLPILKLELLPHDVVNHLSMEEKKIYQSFFDIQFTIGMKGFLPGFIYLAGLPEQMHIPRKSTPDRSIPQGSVAIGGAQCGIYPIQSPGGWHVIGNCPIPLIDLTDENLSCFNVGDEVQFIPIDKAKHILYSTTEWALGMITAQFSTS